MKKILLLVIAMFLFNGCVPWIRTGGPFNASEENVAMELPDGWMRWNTGDYFLITRDGVDLQYVLVEKISILDQLNHTKKKFRKGMLPQEAAEVIMDNIASGSQAHDFEITGNKPAKIDGKPGFRAAYTLKNNDGLKIKGVIYGLILGEWYYGIKYEAPQRYYFDRDLKAFERVVASAHLINQ